MDELLKKIDESQIMLASRLQNLISSGKGLELEAYIRYLSMQYHLTNGVQRHFLMVASHPDMHKLKSLREFLVNFAYEEELHYLIALKDVEALNRDVNPCCLDVKLWKSYFDKIVIDKPFIRLGATCILENITGKSGKLLDELLQNCEFSTTRNTRFLTIHRHEELPHGEQIIQVLRDSKINDAQMNDLIQGAYEGTIMFLRMIDWSLNGDSLQKNI